MKIAMHQLKAGLSRYVAHARAGLVIEITSHDKPVARLIGVPEGISVGLAALLGSGSAQWSGVKPTFRPPVMLGAHPRSMSDIVIEDRA